MASRRSTTRNCTGYSPYCPIKSRTPSNPGNKKEIIFSAFSDTAEYLYEHVSQYIKKKYGLDTAVVTGSVDGRMTVKGLKCTLNNVLPCFSLVSKGKKLLMPDNSDEIDILIATDCISEGQNLQDRDYLINYDIHWNPVRMHNPALRTYRPHRKKKRRNQARQLLVGHGARRLHQLNGTRRTAHESRNHAATGDENPIDDDDACDLEYRRRQLKCFQEEVVDIEDMSGGVSIMDLGLNEFRLDLVDYVKTHGDMDKIPRGLHAVAPASGGLPVGAVFILRNVNDSVHENSRNRIHPFYMVYVKTDGADKRRIGARRFRARLLPSRQVKTRTEATKMLGLPKSTEYGRRIPKQKFYENIAVTPVIRKAFSEQIEAIYWRNKIASSTVNLAEGAEIAEIEIFEIKLCAAELDENVLRRIDRTVPCHIIFILEHEGRYRAAAGYKEAAASGAPPFKVSRYYYTDWTDSEEQIPLRLEGLTMDAAYENFVRQTAAKR